MAGRRANNKGRQRQSLGQVLTHFRFLYRPLLPLIRQHMLVLGAKKIKNKQWEIHISEGCQCPRHLLARVFPWGLNAYVPLINFKFNLHAIENTWIGVQKTPQFPHRIAKDVGLSWPQTTA